MSKPRLLLLSHRLPFPPHSGAAIRTFNILRLLAKHYDITAICFDRMDRATAQLSLSDRIAGLSDFGAFSVFDIPQQRSRARLAWDHLRSLVVGRAYTYFAYESRQFRLAVQRTLAESEFELIHVDSLDLVRYLGVIPLNRVILTHHNTESLLLTRRASAEASATRRLYLRVQAALLRKEEQRWLPRVALNVVVSSDDERQLSQLADGARFEIVPNGVDTGFFVPSECRRDGIVFVGGTSYFPNLDALRWFANAILPELRRKGCSADVHFIGRATADEIARYSGRNGLTLTGYVDDIRPLVNRAACFIVPLRVGGGTRLKLVDAWAMGKAVVSTTIGAEGLEAKDGENLLLCDSETDFADGVIRVLHDPELRTRLEAGARETAERIYSWDVIERDMIAAYEAIRDGVSA